jgi:hypothetical protein
VKRRRRPELFRDILIEQRLDLKHLNFFYEPKKQAKAALTKAKISREARLLARCLNCLRLHSV